MPSLLRRKTPGRRENRRSGEPRKFIDLNDLPITSETPDIRTTVKVAEVYRYEDVRLIRDMVDDGDFVIADLSLIDRDESLFNNVVGELGRIGKDFGGDAGRLGKALVIVTPKGVAIEKQKIRSRIL